MMKDEGPFLLEWVAHHLSLGFTDLVVYTNDCSDGTDEMLIRLEELGLAHHRRNDIPEGRKPQPSALKYAQQEPIVRNSDWVLVLDADEFLCIKQGTHTLDSMVGDAQEMGANGIVITWRIFGSNGRKAWTRMPVTDQYLRAAPATWNKGWGVKTLFKFDPEYWVLGIHRPKIKNKHLETDFPHTVRWLNGSGKWMEDYFKFRGWRSIVRTVGYDWAQVNHYAVKSMDSYAIRKLRGNVNNKKDKYNADYWALQDRNEVPDASASYHKQRREEIFSMLLQDEVLAKLHENALTMVENRLRDIKRTKAYEDLVSGLEQASAVPITNVSAKPPKPRDKEKIAAKMSEVERKLTQDKNKEKTLHTLIFAAEDHYVAGAIDLSDTTPVATYDNRGIQLPADHRIFNATAIDAIVKGKFQRNHARRLPGIIDSTDRYLEVGAGVAFLPAYLSKCFPAMSIVAHEERPELFNVASNVWEANGITSSGASRLSNKALFHSVNNRDEASGLPELLRETGCTFLFVNEPKLTADALAAALSKCQNTAPARVVVGHRAFGKTGNRDAYTMAMAALNYHPEAAQPLVGSLILRRKT